jgi:hypothetical protein
VFLSLWDNEIFTDEIIWCLGTNSKHDRDPVRVLGTQNWPWGETFGIVSGGHKVHQTIFSTFCLHLNFVVINNKKKTVLSPLSLTLISYISPSSPNKRHHIFWPHLISCVIQALGHRETRWKSEKGKQPKLQSGGGEE